MKRPNSYGAVIYLGKNRRRPWAARVTDLQASAESAVNGQRTRKYKYIGYAETKAEAYEILDKYNANKTPINYLGITFGEIWQAWADRNLNKGSKARAASYKAAIKKCEPLFPRRITNIRLADLQEIADQNAGASKSTLNNIKIVMSFVFEWAIKNDIVEKDYSKFVEISAKKTENHIPLTHTQVNDLMALPAPNFTQKLILLYLFTGCRPSELLELKKADVHLDEQYIHIRKAKTAAGVRLVPLADKIIPIARDLYNSAVGNAFINCSYDEYITAFAKILPDHTPHDTRSTFISRMTEKDVPQIIIQKIVGHATGNVTGDVYTRLSLQPLLDAVNKL